MMNNITKVDFAAGMSDRDSQAAFGEDTFTMKIGGTYYDVSTHYNSKGRQSVLQQFKDLIENKGLI